MSTNPKVKILNILTLEVLCSYLCHDFANPASSISNALEMLDDPGIDKKGVMDLLNVSAIELVERVELHRIAYGRITGPQSTDEIFQKISKLMKHGKVHFINERGSHMDVGASKALLNLAIVINSILSGHYLCNIHLHGAPSPRITMECTPMLEGDIGSHALQLLAILANRGKVFTYDIDHISIKAHCAALIFQEYGFFCEVVRRDDACLCLSLS